MTGWARCERNVGGKKGRKEGRKEGKQEVRKDKRKVLRKEETEERKKRLGRMKGRNERRETFAKRRSLPLHFLLKEIGLVLPLLEIAEQGFIAKHATILAQLLIVDPKSIPS